MAVDVFAILYASVSFALLGGLYGVFIAVVWTPFLTSARVRQLFAMLPPDDWRLAYVLWMPLPAMLWASLFATGLSVSGEIRQPTQAASLYVAGLDGIGLATVVSLLLWPGLLLYVLPASGVDWYADHSLATTVALVVAGVSWYLLWLVGPAYVLSVFAGFGQAMSGG